MTGSCSRGGTASSNGIRRRKAETGRRDPTRRGAFEPFAVGRVILTRDGLPGETFDRDLLPCDTYDVERVPLAAGAHRGGGAGFDDDRRSAVDPVACGRVTGEAQMPVTGQEQVDPVRDQRGDGVVPGRRSRPSGGATARFIER